MKKIIISSLVSIACALSAQAQFFTNGNLAVVRIGGPNQSVTTSDSGNTVWIDQYTTSGTLVNSYAIPSTGPNALVLNGEPYEGYLTLTPDGTHLVMGGFNTSAPYMSNGAPANVAYSYSATVPRAIATLDAYGNYALPIANTGIFNTYTISGAVSDGSNFWAEGTGTSTPGLSGVVYCGTALAGATIEVAPGLFGGGRGLNIYNNGLYAAGYSSNGTFKATEYGAGGYLLSNISGALPTAATVFTNLFPSGTSSASTASDLVIDPTGTMAYLADYSFGIVKYTNSGLPGDLWVSNYTIVLTNQGYSTASGSFHAISVTADFTQTPPVVYATSGEAITNRLVMFQDTNADGLDTVINLASNLNVTGPGGSTNTFRGVRFVPQAYAYIAVPPVAFFGNPGETATFSATVLGVPTPTCQWYSNSVADPTYVAIPGATSKNLSLADITTNQDGSQFYLVVSNVYGTSQSAPVNLSVNNTVIVAEPMGATNFPGTGPVSLCVTAVSTETLTYQWLSNGVPIAGAQSSCYTAPGSAVSNTILYSVIVSNSLNESIASTPAIVSFTPYLLYDTFTYPDGNLFGDPGSPWKEISANTTPIFVIGDRVQIAETNAVSGTAFAQSLYTEPQSGAVMWASFIINLTTLPSDAGGTYFAHFEDTNFGFYGRIFALTSNNPAYTPDIPNVAYPGTYRLGISGKASAPTAVVELDMAPGIDYQVVAYFDMTGGFSQLAVNPSQSEYNQVYSLSATPTTLASALTTDTFAPPPLPMAAYGLREAAGGGILELDNLEVSYDWNYAVTGSGFAAVTAGAIPSLPVIGFLTPGVTNYAGNSNILEVAASGIDLTYAWYQNGAQLTDGTNISGSATPTLTLSYLEGTNSGSYTVVVSDDAGSVTSSVAVVSVETNPVAPVFTLQPLSTTNSVGATVTFTATAVGTGPITYQWNTDSSPNGATGSSYTLTRITTNLSGNTYSVTATGGTGLTTTSSNAVLTVLGPVVTNIAFLRSLQVTSAAPMITIPASDSTTVYQVTGVVIVSTNVESATYAEYWIQDATAGIEFFVVDPNFRPHLGDVVTVSGVVDIYSDAVELDGSANNPSEPYYVVSTNGESSPLPYAPNLIPFGFATANPGLSSLVYQGSLGTFTNVYFTTPGAVIGNEDTLEVTNKAGQFYYIYTGESDGPDIIGQKVPTFAYSVTAVYDQYEEEYELNVTAGSDIVTNPPPAVTDLAAAVTSSNITLTWTAVPTAYTYSVWSTTNLAVPFAPLAPGLWFTNTSGTYTGVVSGDNPATFYEIVSP
jgi:hypothetical protein